MRVGMEMTKRVEGSETRLVNPWLKAPAREVLGKVRPERISI